MGDGRFENSNPSAAAGEVRQNITLHWKMRAGNRPWPFLSTLSVDSRRQVARYALRRLRIE